MIIHRNYIPSALPKGTDIAELTASVIGPLTGIVENSGIDPLAAEVHLVFGER